MELVEIPLIVVEAGGYCDPETGLCVTPETAEGDEIADDPGVTEP